jgi:signal transduction histidine kinase
MAIVKTLADRHRADVRVESQEGQGTSIEVRFPAGQA